MPSSLNISPLASAFVTRIVSVRRQALFIDPLDQLAWEIKEGLLREGWRPKKHSEGRAVGGKASAKLKKSKQILRQAIISAIWETLPAEDKTKPRSDKTPMKILEELDRWKAAGYVSKEIATAISAAPTTIRGDLNAIGVRSPKRRGNR